RERRGVAGASTEEAKQGRGVEQLGRADVAGQARADGPEVTYLGDGAEARAQAAQLAGGPSQGGGAGDRALDVAVGGANPTGGGPGGGQSHGWWSPGSGRHTGQRGRARQRTCSTRPSPGAAPPARPTRPAPPVSRNVSSGPMSQPAASPPC